MLLLGSTTTIDNILLLSRFKMSHYTTAIHNYIINSTILLLQYHQYYSLYITLPNSTVQMLITVVTHDEIIVNKQNTNTNTTTCRTSGDIAARVRSHVVFRNFVTVTECVPSKKTCFNLFSIRK